MTTYCWLLYQYIVKSELDTRLNVNPLFVTRVYPASVRRSLIDVHSISSGQQRASSDIAARQMIPFISCNGIIVKWTSHAHCSSFFLYNEETMNINLNVYSSFSVEILLRILVLAHYNKTIVNLLSRKWFLLRIWCKISLKWFTVKGEFCPFGIMGIFIIYSLVKDIHNFEALWH